MQIHYLNLLLGEFLVWIIIKYERIYSFLITNMLIDSMINFHDLIEPSIESLISRGIYFHLLEFQSISKNQIPFVHVYREFFFIFPPV